MIWAEKGQRTYLDSYEMSKCLRVTLQCWCCNVIWPSAKPSPRILWIQTFVLVKEQDGTSI
jgi:hypothetical protein